MNRTSFFKRVSITLVIAAFIAGCGSSVKLDKPPVEDKGATSTTSSGSTGQSSVAPVELGKSAGDNAGPVGVARIVYFDFDSYVIKPEFQSLVEANASYLKASPSHKVVLEGHTDERGGSEYNLALGQKRAEAVRRALALLGVPDSQMEAISFGKEKPAAQGHDEAAYAKNRRVEFSYR